jgi:hypothetical protein
MFHAWQESSQTASKANPSATGTKKYMLLHKKTAKG